MLEYELHAPKPSTHNPVADVFRRLPHTPYPNERHRPKHGGIKEERNKTIMYTFIVYPNIKGRFLVLFRIAHWRR